MREKSSVELKVRRKVVRSQAAVGRVDDQRGEMILKFGINNKNTIEL